MWSGTGQESLDSGEIAHGILEVMQDGYGFIRCENYLPEKMMYMSRHLKFVDFV